MFLDSWTTSHIKPKTLPNHNASYKMLTSLMNRNPFFVNLKEAHFATKKSLVFFSKQLLQIEVHET